MVKRKINTEHYIKVGFVTLLIFLLGVSLGFIIDNERVGWLLTESRDQEVRYQSLQLQYLYLSGLENTTDSCKVLEATLENSIAELGKTLDTLEEYQKNTNINKEDYEQIRHRYILDNLRYWLFIDRMKKVCNKDLVTILYFYSGEDCSICPDQGVVLTYYKNIFKDRLLIFPINTDQQNDEPMVSILKKRYELTVYPTLIIEGVKHEGIVSKDELKGIICSSFATKQPECQD